MEKPRVLILGKLPPPIMGPAIATEIILNSRLKDAYELSHFDTRINDRVKDMGKVKFSKIAQISRLYKTYRHTLREVKPHLVLVPIGQTSAGFFKDIPFIRLAAKSRIKVVIQLRGSAFKAWFDSIDNFRKKLVARHISMADGAIVLGDNLKYLFADFFDDRQIFSVPNGGDFDFPDRKSQTLRVIYLANFLPGKGLLEVLQALEKIKDEPAIPAFEFVAYGAWDNPDYQSKCEKIAAKLNFVELRTSVCGGAKWQALADADVFVFAPKSPEGHPWSIVEAIAAGLPVVSTNRGAIAQSVRDGENGFLLENPEPMELAEKFSLLLKDGSLRKKMGRESRKLYENQFTASAMTDKLSGVFEKILAEQCAE